MDEIVTIIFLISALVLPFMFLLFFYSFKSKRAIWLTIPASALVFALGMGTESILNYMGGWTIEFFMLALLFLAVYAAIVSAVTALAALIKSRQKKQPNLRIPAIIAAVICAAALSLALHNTFLNSIGGYRQILDRHAFTRLTEIQSEDIAVVEASVWRVNPEGAYEGEREHIRIDYHGDMTFFADLEYERTHLPGQWQSWKELDHTVYFTLQDNGSIYFVQYDGDVFRVSYQNSSFYVKSPQLLADIT